MSPLDWQGLLLHHFGHVELLSATFDGHLGAAMWVGAFRQFDHSSQETNSAIEGYHTSIKTTFSTDKVLLRGRRVDWLVFMLTKKVLAMARDRAVSKLCGFQPNTKQEKATIQAVREGSSFTPATSHLT